MRKMNFVASMDEVTNMALDCAIIAEELKGSEDSKVVKKAEAVAESAELIFSRAQRSIIACYKADGEKYKLINFKATRELRARKSGRFSGGDETLLGLLMTTSHGIKNEATKHLDVPSIQKTKGGAWRKTDADQKRFKEIIEQADVILKTVG